MCDNGSNLYHVTIPKQELASLPMQTFKGEITIVEDIENVSSALEYLRSCGIIGFDTETKPNFKKGCRNHVALLQLSSHTHCFLFRLCKIGLPKQLQNFLEDESITKIGLSIHDDFHNLRELSPSLNPKGFIDLQPYVKKFLITDNSLARIYAILFGKRISKSQQLTNWEAPLLKDAQMAYAALDALACIDIYDYLNSGKFIPEKSKYYQEIISSEED